MFYRTRVAILVGVAAVVFGSCEMFFGSDKAPREVTEVTEVTEVAVETTETSIELTWRDPGGRDLDYVRVVTTVDGRPPTKQKIDPGVQTLTLSQLMPGMKVTFELAAVDRGGTKSDTVEFLAASDIGYTVNVGWDSTAGGELTARTHSRSFTLAGTGVSSAGTPAGTTAGSFTATTQPLRTVGAQRTGAVVVKYRDGASVGANAVGAAAALAAPGLARIRIDPARRDEIDRIVADYAAMPEVEYAEAETYVYALGEPDDPGFADQWNFSQLNMPLVWDVVTGDSAVVVAVLDTGIKQSIADFATTHFVDGYDFTTDTTIPDGTDTDGDGHGTHVAGTVTQSTNNGTGVAGMAYGVSVMPVRVLDAEGAGTSTDVALGIRWAADNGAEVINMSLGEAGETSSIADAVQYAYDKDVVLVAATGNESSAVLYPAAYDPVLAVGATDENKDRAPYSNFGPEIDVAAPGGMFFDLNGNGSYDTTDEVDGGILQGGISNYEWRVGTSMASPHVAALAALLLSEQPDLTPEEVYSAIRFSAEDLGQVGFDQFFGYGLINPLAALGVAAISTSDSQDEFLNVYANPVDSWSIAADDGYISAQVAFRHAQGDLNLYLLNADGEQVAAAESVTDNESLLYDATGASGAYTVEVRYAE